MNDFKTPSPRMAGFLSIGLFLLFAFSYVAPVLNLPWIKQPPQFDAALQQTLLVLLVGCFSYYIGATRQAEIKNETIARQATTIAATAAAAPVAASALDAAKPTGTPSDPVAVAPVDPPTDFQPTKPL